MQENTRVLLRVPNDEEAMLESSGFAVLFYDRFLFRFSRFDSAFILFYRAMERAENCQPLCSQNLRDGHGLPSVHLTSALVYRNLLFFPELFQVNSAHLAPCIIFKMV